MIGRVINDASNRITQHYGSGGHGGVDLGWRSDENQNRVFAHSAGTVIAAVDGRDKYPYDDNTMETYGNYVQIDHGNGYMTLYAHLRKGTVSVSVGQHVDSNTQIAVIGESGYVTARHLHFEVFQNGSRINPEPYLSQGFAGGGLTYQAHDSVYGWNPNVSATNFNEYAGNFGINIDAIYLDTFRLRVHDMVQNEWLPWVQNRNDYAGNFGHAIDAIQAETPLFYRVYIHGEGWTEPVAGGNICGTYGKAIDAVQFTNVGPC